MDRVPSDSSSRPRDTATSVKRSSVSARSGSASRQAEKGRSAPRNNVINMFVFIFLSFVV